MKRMWMVLAKQNFLCSSLHSHPNIQYMNINYDFPSFSRWLSHLIMQPKPGLAQRRIYSWYLLNIHTNMCSFKSFPINIFSCWFSFPSSCSLFCGEMLSKLAIEERLRECLRWILPSGLLAVLSLGSSAIWFSKLNSIERLMDVHSVSTSIFLDIRKA